MYQKTLEGTLHSQINASEMVLVDKL